MLTVDEEDCVIEEKETCLLKKKEMVHFHEDRWIDLDEI
jgi:hypothetical protein